jgi:hypothetical protein
VASTELSAGTGRTTAFAAVVGAVETAVLLTAKVAVAALAGATKVVAARATAAAMAIKGFLIEVIVLLN